MSEEVTKDMIGCLCWFFDKGCEKDPRIDILEEVDEYGNVYSKHTCAWWECCRPVKPDEIKFYEYDDRYNCCAENEALRLKNAELEKQNKELEHSLVTAYRGFDWICEQADTTEQDDYDESVILSNVVKDCEDEKEKIKERLADDSKTIYTYRGKQISALDYYLGKAKEILEEIKEK